MNELRTDNAAANARVRERVQDRPAKPLRLALEDVGDTLEVEVALVLAPTREPPAYPRQGKAPDVALLAAVRRSHCRVAQHSLEDLHRKPLLGRQLPRVDDACPPNPGEHPSQVYLCLVHRLPQSAFSAVVSPPPPVSCRSMNWFSAWSRDQRMKLQAH